MAINITIGAPLTYIEPGSQIPLNPVVGTYWMDMNTCTGYVYNGAQWLSIGVSMPASPGPSIDDLCEMHPGLAELRAELKEAQEKFEAYLALVREN